ncbi:MAG: ATP-binding protein, partial [Phycisphaeraceae bacterium]
NGKFGQLMGIPDEMLAPGADSVLPASIAQQRDGTLERRIGDRSIEIQFNRTDDGGYVLLAHDVTHRRQTEEDLRAAKDRAETATQAKSAFLANMSHEIRTPMTAILGFTALLDEPELSAEERGDAVTTIRRNGDHLLAVINDILDLSKIEAGKMNLEKLDISPAEAITDVRDLLVGYAAKKGLGLELELGDLPSTIQTDPTRLRQILANLVSNAIKFTETGTVTIGADWEAHEQGVLRVAVRDTGIGMSQAYVGRIFEAFSQADDSMSRRFGGTGLGLKISSRLAEMLGGRISVESTPGVGSTFTLSIETGVVNAGERKATEVTARQDELSGCPLEGVRILLAEDGLDNQRLITFHLHKAGAEVTVTNNGVEVLQAWDADPGGHELILLDMQMPEIDGYQAAWSLRHRGWRGPILALTAHAMAEDRDRCLAAGCSDYGSKPIDRDDLIRMCLNGLEQDQEQRTAA